MCRFVMPNTLAQLSFIHRSHILRYPNGQLHETHICSPYGSHVFFPWEKWWFHI